MLYEPGDPQKIIDTVIALDLAVCTLCKHLSLRDATGAAEIAAILKTLSAGVYETFHADEARGISDKLRE